VAIETINYNGSVYPKLQTEGFAAKFAFPFAKALGLCDDEKFGYDVGCHRYEWCLPTANPIDPVLDPRWDAYRLPRDKADFIFSSHCLEHLPDWVAALDYWATVLIHGGILFLYLPHPDQKYWRPWNNRKHLHSISPEIITQYFTDRWDRWNKFFVTTGWDLNHSFYAIAERI